MYDENEPLTAKDFKEGLTGICKFAFWCMFIYYIGFFHLIASFFRTNIIESGDRGKSEIVINKFLDEEYAQAKIKMDTYGKYSPNDYFKMLQMVNHLEDSVGLANGFQFSRISEIQQFMAQSLNKGSYTYDELDRAKSWFEKHPLPEVKKLPKIQRPHICERYICHITVPNIFNWILYVYLHMLPFVFLLLLIWVWQKKDPETLSLKSPLSFILLLLIHPVYMTIVIVRAWKKFFREWTASVEVRRRKKNIFEKFSEEERMFIQAFAKNTLSFKEFFQWAETLGKRRHITAFAVVATMLCSIPYAKAGEALESNPHYSTIQTADTNNHVSSVDVDIGHHIVTLSNLPKLYDLVSRPILRVNTLYGKNFHFLLPLGYKRTLEPVPLYY